VECYPDGQGANRAAACVEHNVNSYPTWQIAGQWYSEILSPQRLASLSNYATPPPGKP
jgi:hypothetical protein